jgi:T5orf172 domain
MAKSIGQKRTHDDRPAYTYLLVHAIESRFKIGWAHDTVRRSSAFDETLDFARSRQVRCENENDAIRLEKILHKLFDRQRLIREKSDGYTEWFDLSAFDDVLKLVSHLAQDGSALLRCSDLQPVAPRRNDLAKPGHRSKCTKMILSGIPDSARARPGSCAHCREEFRSIPGAISQHLKSHDLYEHAHPQWAQAWVSSEIAPLMLASCLGCGNEFRGGSDGLAKHLEFWCSSRSIRDATEPTNGFD